MIKDRRMIGALMIVSHLIMLVPGIMLAAVLRMMVGGSAAGSAAVTVLFVVYCLFVMKKPLCFMLGTEHSVEIVKITKSMEMIDDEDSYRHTIRVNFHTRGDGIQRTYHLRCDADFREQDYLHVWGPVYKLFCFSVFDFDRLKKNTVDRHS